MASENRDWDGKIKLDPIGDDAWWRRKQHSRGDGELFSSEIAVK